MEWSAQRDVHVGRTIHPLGMFRAQLPQRPGPYTLHAALDLGGEAVETTQPLLLVEPIAPATGQGAQVLGRRITRLLPAAELWSGGRAPLLAEAEALHAETITRVAEWVRGGG